MNVLPWHHENVGLLVQNTDRFVNIWPAAMLNHNLEIREISCDSVYVFGSAVLYIGP